MSDCITNLCRKVNSLLLRVTSLEALMNGGESPTAFFFNVTGGSSAGDITGGAAQVGPGIDETLNVWSSGGLAITVTDGSARVRIEPSNLSDAFTTAGPPATPPKDSTRPALHLAANGLYFWSPSTVSWVLVNLIPVGDDWGSQVAVSDGATVGGTGVLGDPLRVIGVPGLVELHSETGAIPLSADGIIHIPEVDVNDVPTGRETLLDVSPSSDSCNGLQIGTDFRHYSEDYGYRIARTFAELEALINSEQDVLVCSQLTMTADATLGALGSTSNVRFVLNGSIETDGFLLIINCGFENPRNKRIFYGYVLDETYPARAQGLGSTIRGSFGGDNVRDTRWWGLVASPNEEATWNEPLSKAQLNNNAIAAAALSSDPQEYLNPLDYIATFPPNRAGPISVRLPYGGVAIHRTVRLDSIRAHLVGPENESMHGVRLDGRSSNYEFDTSYFIVTEDYPDLGTTPMVQIGWQIQSPEIGIDSGFGSGVRNLTIACPTANPARRVSGIMWEHGLQEGSSIRYVAVKGHTGYGIGGPRRQYFSHNVEPAPNTAYLQLNTVEFNNLWIFTPFDREAIGMNIFGLNFIASVITVAHKEPALGMNRPAIITDSRTCGSWKNIHIEISPSEGVEGIGILVPSNGTSNSKMSFESINLLGSSPILGTLKEYTTLSIEKGHGGFSCRAISAQIAYDVTPTTGPNAGVNFQARAIKDTVTGKESTGYFNNLESSSYVASYDRQVTAGVYQVASSDPAMLNNVFYGEVVYDPPSLLDGEGVTTTVPVSGAFTGDYVDVSFGINTQGVTLFGWVNPNGTANVRFQNETGGTVDLASSTLRVKVRSKNP